MTTTFREENQTVDCSKSISLLSWLY